MSATDSTTKPAWEAAKWYIEYGGTLVPTIDKHPYTEEWQHTRSHQMDDDYIRTNLCAEGMAILTGIPGGPIIVDVDNPELETIIENRLPKTPIKVRTGKSIHLWFGQNGSQIENIHRAGILDVLSTGKCAIVPPSPHPTGKKYKIIIDQPLFDSLQIITWEDLPCLSDEDILWLRTFSPKAPHLKVVENKKPDALPEMDFDGGPAIEGPVSEGGRNVALTSLVGQWIHEIGLDHGKLLDHAMEWNASNNPPLDNQEMLRTVLSVIKTHVLRRFKEGKPISDSPSIQFSPMLLEPKEKVSKVLWSPEPAIEDPNSLALMTPPGILNDIKQWILDTSPQPQPGFAVQAALAIGSVVCARIWKTESNNFTSLYLVNIGDSGAGKERPLSATEEILIEAGLEDLVGPDAYTGSTAIHDMMMKSPAHLTRLDEMGDYLSIIQDRGQGMAMDGVRALKSIWGKLDGTYVGKAFASTTTDAKQREPIIKPGISILGATTPMAFYRSLRIHDLEGGLIPRLLIYETTEKEVVPRNVVPIPVPTKITDWLKAIRHNPIGNLPLNIGTMDVTPRIIKFHDVARDIYNTFGEKIIRAKEIHRLSGMHVAINRTREKALRIGAICSLFVNNETPEITPDIAEWSCQYAWACDNQTLQMLKCRLSVTDFENNKILFLEAIRYAGSRGFTKSEMAKVRPFRSVKERERKEIVADLVDAKLIALAKCPTRGHERLAYVAIKDLSENA